jgi:hypothetical protein
MKPAQLKRNKEAWGLVWDMRFQELISLSRSRRDGTIRIFAPYRESVSIKTIARLIRHLDRLQKLAVKKEYRQEAIALNLKYESLTDALKAEQIELGRQQQ